MNRAAEVIDHWRSLIITALNLRVTSFIALVNIPLVGQLCYFTMESQWKNTRNFIDLVSSGCKSPLRVKACQPTAGLTRLSADRGE